MPIFTNPNDPPQPQIGVYSWTAIRGTITCCIYVGQAGHRKSVLKRGTLARGAGELQRNTFSSDSGCKQLDTDFIVGTAIAFFEKADYRCFWEHIDNDPTREVHHSRVLNPILQDGNARIKDEFRCAHGEHYWRLATAARASKEQAAMIQQAEEELHSVLRKHLPL